MSKEITGQTMGQLAADGGHQVSEAPAPGVLLAGSVIITADAEGARRATELKAALDRAMTALRSAGLLAIALLLMFALQLPAGASDQRVVSAGAPRATWSPRPASERQWPGLTREQLRRLNAALRKIPSARIEIYCGGNYCRALAEDLDEAFESAGHDSYLEVSLFDMGKGVGISPANDDTRAIAATLTKVTNGKVTLKVFDPLDGKGHAVAITGRIIIALARKPH